MHVLGARIKFRLHTGDGCIALPAGWDEFARLINIKSIQVTTFRSVAEWAPSLKKGDGRLRPSLQQRLPGAEGPPVGFCSTPPRHAACGGPFPAPLRPGRALFCSLGGRARWRGPLLAPIPVRALFCAILAAASATKMSAPEAKPLLPGHSSLTSRRTAAADVESPHSRR